MCRIDYKFLDVNDDQQSSGVTFHPVHIAWIWIVFRTIISIVVWKKTFVFPANRGVWKKELQKELYLTI